MEEQKVFVSEMEVHIELSLENLLDDFTVVN